MRTTIRGQGSEVTGRNPRRLGAVAIATALLAFASTSSAQFVVNWGFTPGTTVPDNGSVGTVNTLGGFASYSNINVSLNLTSQTSGDPMFLGDMYANLRLGNALAGETPRTAVLLNRPGRDDTNPFGSSASSLNVLLDDSATQPNGNVWASNGVTGTYNSDGRGGVNPNAAGVAFNPADRNATLAALNGNSFASNRFTLLLADYSQGGTATLSSYGYGVTGAAAGSGTLSGDGGTFSISDTGSGAVNNVGAAVVTTQPNGAAGALTVNIAGTMNFTNGVSGTSGLTKSGAGTLTLSGTGTYLGATAVNGGKLFVNGNNSGATGAVTVNNSGTVLGGAGTIGGAVTVNSGAIIRGGTGATASGALTVNNASVTLNSGSIIELALAASGNHSTLAHTGTGGISFQSNQAFSFIDLGAQATTYDNIITGLAANPGTTGTWVILNDGWAGTFSYENGNIDLDLTAVPEPSTWLAAAFAFGGILFTQRRRLRRFSIQTRRHGAVATSNPLQ